MKLQGQTQSLEFEANDLHGKKFSLSHYQGKAVILSFFRDTSCQFCLKRVFEMAAKQRKWRKSGVEVIAIFASTPEKMPNFKKNNFDRFRVVPDSNLEIYDLYKVEHFYSSLLKKLLFKVPNMINNLKKRSKVEQSLGETILPADFLIDPTGLIVETWYGKDQLTNIPMERIQKFVQRIASNTNQIKMLTGDKLT